MQTITEIQQQKKNKSRYSVFLDGEYAFSISEELSLRHHLQVDMQIDKEQLVELLKEEENKSALQKGADYISYCARTLKQTKDYLCKKGFSQESMDYALEKLQEYNMLNDAEYAQRFVSNKSTSALMGRQAIKYKLMQKGIDKDTSGTALEEYDEESELQAARAYIEKTAAKYAPLAGRERAAKLSAALARRGFGWSVIKRAINSEEDEFDD